MLDANRIPEVTEIRIFFLYLWNSKFMFPENPGTAIAW
jgi:hypothetical protein